MLVELLRPVGPELSRRWLAALLAVPAAERERVVAEIESRVAQVYAAQAQAGPRKRGKRGSSLDVVQPPVQREGYVEQVVTTYDVAEEGQETPAQRKRKASGA